MLIFYILAFLITHFYYFFKCVAEVYLDIYWWTWLAWYIYHLSNQAHQYTCKISCM